MSLAIRCRDLRKTYDAKPPVEAVRGLDLEIPAGQCFGLLGPNGAGKTTTVEILEGILEPTAGDVEVLGLRWGKDDHDLRQRIGVSLQETKLADKLTVEETVRLFGSFYRKGRPPIDVMKEVGLLEKRKSWVMNLSGGQKQRLAVACALVGDPDLGSPDELIATLGGEHVVEFAVNGAAPPPDAADLMTLPSVSSSREEAGGFQLTVTQPHVAIPALLKRLTDGGHALSKLTTRHASLEDVFVSLTGRHLRDE